MGLTWHSSGEGEGGPCEMLTEIPSATWPVLVEEAAGSWMTDNPALKVPLGLHHFPVHPPHLWQEEASRA